MNTNITQTDCSAIDHELKEMIERAAAFFTTDKTFDLVINQMSKRKGYAKEFLKTGNKNLLPHIDICNNNIKKLLGL